MKKTVSQLTGADILCTYRPTIPAQAIVDTEICMVEQIIMLKADSEDAVPQQAFIVVTKDGTRFVEIDHAAKDYDGTAWLLFASMRHPYMSYAQCRFLTKNIITALKAENYSFPAVYGAVMCEFRHAHIQGLCDPGSRSVLSNTHREFETYLRTVCEDLLDEIEQEVENAGTGSGTGSTN